MTTIAAEWMLTDRVNALGRAGQALARAVRAQQERVAARLGRSGHRLSNQSPALRLERQRSRFATLGAELTRLGRRRLEERENRLSIAERGLEAVSPLAVLERGYSVTLKNGKPVRDAADLKAGDELETRLHRGRVTTRVENTDPSD